jgi:hypothetical protein
VVEFSGISRHPLMRHGRILGQRRRRLGQCHPRWGQKSAHLPQATAIPNQLPVQPRPPLCGPGGVLLPAPEPESPPPPRDFRTWLHEALSDKNVRYYAGPHLYEALLKLHALTQLLPGSGTVQSTQEA